MPSLLYTVMLSKQLQKSLVHVENMSLLAAQVLLAQTFWLCNSNTFTEDSTDVE